VRTEPGAARSGGRTRLAGLDFDGLTEAQTVGHIIGASLRDEGGWVATPNVDICRQVRHDPALRHLVGTASLVVPDGMPLVWAARLRGHPLPERVAGGSLIFSLSEAAARQGLSIYLLGGAPGVPERAGEELSRRYPGLRVVGADSPPLGFDTDPRAIADVRDWVAAARPDIVYVGLGFPKQERLIARLAPACPRAWFVGCGAAIPYAAKALPRPPAWMRRAGLAWLFRLFNEPRRLFRRYLVHDLPFAIRLLTSAVAGRFSSRHSWLGCSCQERRNASTRPSARDRVSTAGRPRWAREASASAASFSGCPVCECTCCSLISGCCAMIPASRTRVGAGCGPRRGSRL
jgi:N-acetylglucosaminyldiphosphoundecaprenol N-acetyl-beta-D-mannosaminyltransferase